LATKPAVATWHGELAGHRVHAALGHRVGEVAATQRRRAGDRRDVDDRAVTPGDHAAPGRTGAEEVAGEVHREDTLPRLDIDLERQRTRVNASVVDQHADVTELDLDLGEGGLDLLLAGDVAGP
jgi:hypothetical protein